MSYSSSTKEHCQVWPLTHNVKLSLLCLRKPLPQRPGVCIFGESITRAVRHPGKWGRRVPILLSTLLSRSPDFDLILSYPAIPFPQRHPDSSVISLAFPQPCPVPFRVFHCKTAPSTSLPSKPLPILSSTPGSAQLPSAPAPRPPRQPIAEHQICIAARGSGGGKGEGPDHLLNQSWEARTGRRGRPGAGLGPSGEGGKGEWGAGAEDSGAGRERTAPSLPPSAHLRVPTSLLPWLRAASSADPRSSFPGSSLSRRSV